MPANNEVNRAKKILDLLEREYPEVKSALDFNSPFELLISTILSAQCTDERVNTVTKVLFKKYRKPEDFISVPDEELEKDIFSTGFYKQKAKSVKKCCSDLVNKFGGKVPEDFDALITLPGVGRKTASVVMGNAFGVPALPVDTHIKRLSNLLGFIDSDDPEKIEMRLKELFPEKEWTNAIHRLINHARKVCIARRPKCQECVISKYCPSSKA